MHSIMLLSPNAVVNVLSSALLLLRRYMKMSQSQFDSLEENSKQTFLEKQLWIKEKFQVGLLTLHRHTHLLVCSADSLSLVFTSAGKQKSR